MFENYLQTITNAHAAALKTHVIDVVSELAPEAVEGLSYGLPAFKLNDRPLIGFSSNKHGLNVYPFDPRIVRHVVDAFPNLEHSKGVVRFSTDEPIPKKALELMTSLRLDHLKK